MLFLFRGHHGPLIRAIAGALLLAAGALSAHRARRYRQTGTTGGAP